MNLSSVSNTNLPYKKRKFITDESVNEIHTYSGSLKHCNTRKPCKLGGPCEIGGPYVVIIKKKEKKSREDVRKALLKLMKNPKSDVYPEIKKEFVEWADSIAYVEDKNLFLNKGVGNRMKDLSSLLLDTLFENGKNLQGLVDYLQKSNEYEALAILALVYFYSTNIDNIKCVIKAVNLLDFKSDEFAIIVDRRHFFALNCSRLFHYLNNNKSKMESVCNDNELSESMYTFYENVLRLSLTGEVDDILSVYKKNFDERVK